MGNHLFNAIVVVFWLATMSWLIVAKVLPPLRLGEPPNYKTILKESDDDSGPAIWSIRLQSKTIGWAATKIGRRKDGISEISSRVYLSELPIDEILPSWVNSLLKSVVKGLGPMDVDKKSRLVIDPLGRLVGFESHVRLGDVDEAIKVQGQTDNAWLRLSVHSGGVSRKFDCYLAPNALMADELAPQSRMPHLRVGQTWTVPIYSPFRSPSSPLDILQALVEREDTITWEGRNVKGRVIVYRSDAGSGMAGDEVRGRLWVRDDGVVLRQEAAVFKSRLYFVRMSEAGSEEIRNFMEGDWLRDLPRDAARRLLQTLESQSP